MLQEQGYLITGEPQFVKDRVQPHAAGLWAFADAVLDNTPVPIPGEEAIVTQKIIDGLYKSSQLGRDVKIG